MNKIVEHWIVKRKYLLGSSSYHLLVFLESGKYYYSNGEFGEFSEISEEEAKKMIDREL
jgi:hypothetical protein